MFVRARARFLASQSQSWAYSLQPEHGLAYLTWSDTGEDTEEVADIALSTNEQKRQGAACGARRER